ncbi:MAG: mechanosensitive ion channel domain-containing protein [Opitutaceae bacterium]
MLTGTQTAATAPSPDTALTPATIETRRATLQKDITRTRAEFDQLSADKSDETTLWLTQEIVLLGRLAGVYAEQLRTLQHAADLAKEAAEVTELTKNPRPPEVRLLPPFGIDLLDQLYAKRDYLVRARSLLKTDIDNVTTAFGDARDDLAAKDRLRRTAKQAVESANKTAQAHGVLRLAELESRIAKETVILDETALSTLQFQQSLLEPKLTLLLPDFDWLTAHLAIAATDPETITARQQKRLAELNSAIARTSEEADQVARLVVNAEHGISATTKNPEADAELESRRADRQTLNLMLGALTAQRDRLPRFAEVIQLRRLTLTGAGTDAVLKTNAKDNDDALERLAKERRPLVTELRKARDELQSLQATLADSASPARTHAWIADRVGHLLAWVDIAAQNLNDLGEITTARERLKEELDGRVSTFSWSDTLTATRTHLVAAWDYEVFSVTDQPIRVKTILIVITLIFAGHWLSRRASDLVGHTVFRRLGMNVGRRTAWQTLSFYAFFIIVLLVATNLFHLSLTQFSVVSGALAVGIGFGSQTLIGNFISGIILLIERPINQGDVIEINGHQMTVERVGPRSTLVRSRDNTHTIVPNSHLLDENVINLTLSDDVIRTRIAVGVAYSSPTREVARLLEEVMLSLENVNREPAPLVVFLDFGESALIFEASFWSVLEGRKEFESELRHRIAETFAKAGILMAFLQGASEKRSVIAVR